MDTFQLQVIKEITVEIQKFENYLLIQNNWYLKSYVYMYRMNNVQGSLTLVRFYW